MCMCCALDIWLFLEWLQSLSMSVPEWSAGMQYELTIRRASSYCVTTDTEELFVDV